MSTSKKTAVVTGASSGIGAVYADRLARRGYDLILVARDQGRLDELAVRLRAETGVAVDVARADLTAPEDVRRIEARVREDPAITFLVNNAGAAYFAPFGAADPDRLDALVQLNAVALTRLASAAVGAFVARGAGTLVNIGSIIALAPELKSPLYGATKAYVLALTQGLNEELAGSGVRLQAVLPGATRTEIWERSGRGIENVPEAILMDVEEMVDAALAGLDQGELVTIPSLPDPGDWQAFEAARLKLAPNLSRPHPAARYGVAAADAA